MQSFAWMNGQYQQIGPSQSQQSPTLRTSPTVWIQQAGIVNNSSSTCVRPPQSAHSTFRDGAYSDRQTSHRQNSGVPHRTVSSQLSAGGESQSQQGATPLTSPTLWIQQVGTANNSSSTCVRPPQSAHSTFRDGAYSDRQTSHRQNSGVPHRTVSSQLTAGRETNIYYVDNLQDSLTNVQNGNPLTMNGRQVATQQGFHSNTGFVIPPNTMKSNTAHPQQDMSARFNQQAHEQMVYTSTSVSASAPKRQTTHNQNRSQRRFSSSNSPPTYNQAVAHSVRNYRTTEQVSSMRQMTQQYQTNVNSRHVNMNYETQRFLSKTNDVPLNPAAATQDQILRSQIIARIEDDLRKSFPQKSNANMQPVTQTITNSYNSNAPISLPLNSGLSLSNCVISRKQHSVNAPQQSSVPNVYVPNIYVTAISGSCGEVRPTDGNRGKAANAIIPESNKVSKGSLVGALHETAQLKNLPESNSRKRKQAESSLPSDILEVRVSSVTANDASIHSSPGRTCTRAVAVVQPLSQESCQVANKHSYSNTMNQSAEHTTSAESLSSPEKLFTSPTVAKNKKDQYIRKGAFLYSQNPNKVSSSDSAGHQDSQKQFCADDTGSEPATGTQEDQCVAMTAQQSVASEVTVRQSGAEDKGQSPTHDNVILLSSVPTEPWTLGALGKLIHEEKAQMEHSNNSAVFNSRTKLLDLHWGGTISNLACWLRTGWYKSLLSNATGYISKHKVTRDSVILSELKRGYKKTLSGYHVLKDDEVYVGLPYKSSWLNVNEQLDDIDKEFGFPWSWKHHLYLPESQRQPDQEETVKSIRAEIPSEVPDKISSQTELEPVDSGEEKRASTPVTASTQADSPDETKCDSSDPFYSFEIQVLSPGEAKVIFEQAQRNMPLSTSTDSQPESVMDSSVEDEPLEAIHVTLNVSEPEIKSSCSVEEVCCLSRWLENIAGSHPPLSGCQCINEKNPKDCAEKTHDKAEMEVQTDDDIGAICSETKFHTEEETQADGQDNVKSEMITYDHSETCNNLSQHLAFAENDDESLSYSDNKPKNISHSSINSSPLSIIVLSENEDGDHCSSDTFMQSDPGVDYIQENAQSCTAVSSYKDIDNPPGSESGISSWLSDLEEDCGQAQLTFTDVGVSTSETEEEQTQLSAMAAMQTTFSHSDPLENVKKRKRQSSHDGSFLSLKKSNKCKLPGIVDSEPSACKEVSIDETDSELLASKVRAVQLALFGSAPKDKSVLIGGRKRRNSSPAVVPDGVPTPPRIISVKLSPLKKKLSDTVPTGEQSVKWRIHEKWRRSLPLTTVRRQTKLKTWKCTFSSSSGFGIKKAEAVVPTNTERPPVSSETRISSSNHGTVHCMSLKKRWRSLPARLKHGEETKRKYRVTLKQPADQERSNAEHGSKAGRPLQENNILRFSVLPNTFDFKDGSNDRKETNDSVPSKS